MTIRLVIPGGAGGQTVTTTTTSVAASVEGDAYTCAAEVSVRDAVYLSGSGAVGKADANDPFKQPVVGLVVSKPTETTCRIIYYGEISGFTGLTVGVSCFLSLTPGEITANPPTSPGSIIQKVGFARSSSTLVVFVDRDYFEN